MMYKYLAHSIIYSRKNKILKPWFNALPINKVKDSLYLFEK